MKLLLSILLLAGILIANDWSKALQAYTSGNKLEAASLLKKESQRGNTAAQAMLGSMYYDGDVLKKDCSQVIKWLKNPAMEGNSKSQVTLAKCYINQNKSIDAIYWLKEASGANNVEAQNILANIYLNGIGVPKNETKALKYLKLAAQNKDKDAILALGLAHAEGRFGFVKNPQQAVEILSTIASYDPAAQYYLGLIYSSQLNNTQQGYQWLKKSADNNFSPAQYYMGKIYLHRKEYYQASKLFIQAAENERTPQRCQIFPAILDLPGNTEKETKLVKKLLLAVDQNLKTKACQQVWTQYKLEKY